MRVSHTIIISIFFCLTISPEVEASQVSLVSYYPEPVGVYDRLQLVAQPLNNPCPEGLIGFDGINSRPMLCRTGVWEPVSKIWTEHINHAYPPLSLTNSSLFMGIGTLTPVLKLTLDNDGGILAVNTTNTDFYNFPTDLSVYSGDSYPALIWYPKKSAFIAGGVDFGNIDDTKIGTATVMLGQNNIASGNFSSILGGWGHTVSGSYSVIGGGLDTQISGNHSGSVWGEHTSFAQDFSVVNGTSSGVKGTNPVEPAGYITILGGNCNFAHSLGATIAGGTRINSTNPCTGPTVSGGDYMTAAGGRHQVGGDYAVAIGENNTVNGNYSVGLGDRATVTGNYSVAYSEDQNSAQRDYATVAGGTWNRIPDTGSGHYGVIGGGSINTVNATYGIVAAGNANQINGAYSVIAGGDSTNAVGQYNVIYNNHATTINGDWSMFAGSQVNLTGNRNFMWYAAPSDYDAPARIVNTSNSFVVGSGAVGIRSKATGANVEINGNGTTDDYLKITSHSGTSGNIFVIKNNGYVGIGTHDPQHPLDFGPVNGAHIATNGNLYQFSSRSAKNHIQNLSADEAKEALTQLRPVTYAYKVSPNEKHVGFIAQDVPDLVAQADHKSLGAMDFAAVLTAVVKDQQEQIEEQNLQLEQIKSRLQAIEKQ